jgi:hypothetical protein
MSVNKVLIIVGISCIAAALYRADALRIDKAFWINVFPIAACAVLFGILNYQVGGVVLFQNGWEETILFAKRFTPMFAVMFLMLGTASAFATYYSAEIQTYLSGGKGHLGALVVAYLNPTSMGSVPIIKTLWDNGTGRTQLLGFLLASRMVGWVYFVIFLPMLGWRLSLIVFATGSVTAWALMACLWLISLI